MAYDAVKIASADSLTYRITLYNILAGSVLAGLLVLFNRTFTPGFAAGFVISFINMLWLLRISRKGTRLAPEKAPGFFIRNYYMRFSLIAIAFFILIYEKVLAPWPMVMGFTCSLFTSIYVMISAAREEVS